MNIVICGAGEVGRYSAEVLAPEGHNITIIDQAPAKLAECEDVMDVRTLAGNGTQADVLADAGCAKADLFIAATNIDEINLLSASIAKAVGAGNCIARVHHSAFIERRGLNYGQHLGIDHLVCPEQSTAAAITQALRSPGAQAVEQFARGRIEMQTLVVNADAPAVGATLRGLKMPAVARLTAIERGGEAFLPEADTVIQSGDAVTVIGESEVFDRVRRMFHTEADSRRRVIIHGGSTQSVWVCRSLRHRQFTVRLFEPDRARAEELAGKLDWVTVLNSDAIHSDALREERVDQADAFIAVTDDDETNILSAARAKSMGAKSAIAVLQRPTYLHLLSHVGIDRAFSPRVTAVTEIQRLIQPGPVRKLATLAEGIAEVYEARVPERAQQITGQPLRDVRFPPRCAVAAIQRGDQDVFVPTAQSTLEAGDTVVLIGPASAQKPLGRFFTGRATG